MKTLPTDSTHAGSPARPSADGLLADAPEPHLPSPDCIQAALLFRGRQEILIGHQGETYRLRITRNGKLILTK